MKKFLVLSGICLLIIVKVFSQDFWKPIPFTDSLLIKSLVVNSDGEIFITTGTDYSPDGIYKSSDEGMNWVCVYTLNEPYYGTFITVAEDGTLYALTSHDILLMSTDNGISWSVKNIPSTGNGVTLKVIGTDTLIVSMSGSFSRLLMSPDRGTTWDTIFVSQNTSEYVSDIEITKQGKIYISLMCFFYEMGGVYSSSDYGNTWEFNGLLSHQVWGLALDTTENLLIGVFSDFVYLAGSVYRFDNVAQTMNQLYFGGGITGIVVNKENEIFAGMVYGGGSILYSNDNGVSFSYLNSGMVPYTPIDYLYLDNADYVYAYSPYGVIYKSMEPTVTKINDPVKLTKKELFVSPNPVTARSVGNFNCNVRNGKYRIIIKNLKGILVCGDNIEIQNNSFSYEFSKLESGIYFISVVCDDVIYSAKIIKS